VLNVVKKAEAIVAGDKSLNHEYLAVRQFMHTHRQTQHCAESSVDVGTSGSSFLTPDAHPVACVCVSPTDRW
jgi:hypothetical protein